MNPRFLKLLLIAISTFLTAACAMRKGTVSRQVSQSTGNHRKPLAVLFIGNSYSFGVPGELKRLAIQNGQRLRIGQVTNGGWSLRQHANDNTTLRAIHKGAWDVVVLQEASRIPSQCFKRQMAMFPAVKELSDQVRVRGATPVLYQTWGYREGDPYHKNDDFHSMTDRVREGCHAAAQYAGGLQVIAVGDAWQREMSAGRGDNLFEQDGSHPSKHGNRITAETFYKTLLDRNAHNLHMATMKP